MRTDAIDSPSGLTRRGLISPRPRRPWLLIVASLLLAILSIVLWAKWEESRVLSERLQAEMKHVYAETEALRTQAQRAQQRIVQLERQLREAPPAPPPPPPPAVARPRSPRARQ